MIFILCNLYKLSAIIHITTSIILNPFLPGSRVGDSSVDQSVASEFLDGRLARTGAGW